MNNKTRFERRVEELLDSLTYADLICKVFLDKTYTGKFDPNSIAQHIARKELLGLAPSAVFEPAMNSRNNQRTPNTQNP